MMVRISAKSFAEIWYVVVYEYGEREYMIVRTVFNASKYQPR